MAAEQHTIASVAVTVAEAAMGLVDIMADRVAAAEKAAWPDPREVAAFVVDDSGRVSAELATGEVVKFACGEQARAILERAALGGAEAARPGARLRRCDYTDDNGRRRSFYAEIAR